MGSCNAFANIMFPVAYPDGRFYTASDYKKLTLKLLTVLAADPRSSRCLPYGTAYTVAGTDDPQEETASLNLDIGVLTIPIAHAKEIETIKTIIFEFLEIDIEVANNDTG